MKSLRAKLILFVLSISLVGITLVMLSNLAISREAQRDYIRATNRQISDLVSGAILNQVTEYRNKIGFIFDSWLVNPEVNVNRGLLPDYLWVQILNSEGQPVFEWSNQETLSTAGLSAEMLLGKKKSQSLYEENRHVLIKPGQWLIFNSSVQPVYPTFLLMTSLTRKGEQESSYYGFAEIHSERLFTQVKGRKGQEVYLMDSHDNVLLSTNPAWDPSEVIFSDSSALKTISQLKTGESYFDDIEYLDRETQVSSFYKFAEGGGLTLMLQEPLSQTRTSEERMQMQSGLIALVILLQTIILVVFFANSMTAPLHQLMKLIEKVGKGEFTGKIVVKSKDEIGRLAALFNKMLSDLKTRDEEIDGAKTRLIQSEKMSAFGQMSAGIAHEVKNPLAGILGYAQMSKKKLPPDSPVVPYMDIIEKETVRCKEIVENLMKFARQEKAVFTRMDVNKTVKDSVRLVEHQISISGIKLVQMYALEEAPIWLKGNSNQIQQVVMNLMLNAQQAMDNKGTITVSTHYSAESQRVLIMVSDTGAGMSDEVKTRIFEPFYTTKGPGKGTGLGLSVSLGIVKDHGGSVEVDSVIGKGTTFTIMLPCDQDQAQPQATGTEGTAAS